MLSMKALVLLLLLSFALNGAEACDGKKRGDVRNSNQSINAGATGNSQTEKPEASEVKDDLKPLAQGQHSSVSNAFIAVARDSQTYEALRKVANNLPELNQDFFQSNVVVAAFLGERGTGGYGVRLTRAASGSIRVEETAPPKGSMVTQVITNPFSAVAVPVANPGALSIDAGNAWQAMSTRTYWVKYGEFTMSGGIAGRKERFGIMGRLSVSREGSLATLYLELKSRDGKKQRTLRDVASGLVQSYKQITFPTLSPGSFVDQPADMLRANLYLSDNDRRLSLSFESIPSPFVRDGFNGEGALTAEDSPPSPPKKKP
jgi:protease stability complex PrcB-like protein